MNYDSSRLDLALEKAISNHKERIGNNDALFLQRIYKEGLGKYSDRLRAIGFTNCNHVLDAGCGFGQWSLALAQLNRFVSACDVSSLRMDVVKDVTRELEVTNLDLLVSGITSLPYVDSSFDAVFCYGVIFLTPWRQSLRELARVLKPGGKLYVSANGLGWYIFLWQEEYNKAKDYDPKVVVAKTFAGTLLYDREGIYEAGMNLIVEPHSLKYELQQLHFSNIQIDREGSIHMDKSMAVPKPFFRGEYFGQTGIYEVLATK